MKIISPNKVKIAIFFGGPSNERNISLDSARTFYDSVRHRLNERNITLVFVSKKLNFYTVPNKFIYSNTVEDFSMLLPSNEIEIAQFSKKKQVVEKTTRKKGNSSASNINTKNNANKQLKALSGEQLATIIAKSHALVPLVHGEFGEDGKLSQLFEAHHRKAYVGSPPETLATSLNKRATQTKIAELGLKSAKNVFFKGNEAVAKMQAEATSILSLNRKEHFFVKPNNGGSSDGVQQIQIDLFARAVKNAKRYSNEILVEKKIRGQEFSIIVLEDYDGHCHPLVPSEVILQPSNSENKEKIFYTRKRKYMPGSGVQHLTPASFNSKVTTNIRREAAELFTWLRFRHWARFDGFITNKQEIIWGELNGIPGMGQDGFLFQQSAVAGLDAPGVAMLLLRLAMGNEGISLQEPSISKSAAKKLSIKQKATKNKTIPIAVIGGGESSERQVSRMSWHNVCLKLKAARRHDEQSNSKTPTYQLHYIFLDKNKKFWEVPHLITLLHTVEEIDEVLLKGSSWHATMRKSMEYLKNFKNPPDAQALPLFTPKLTTLKQLSKKCKYAFIALHGGIGENGILQKKLTNAGMAFNGSGEHASWLCASKPRSSAFLIHNKVAGISALPSKVITYAHIKKTVNVLKEKQRQQLIEKFILAPDHKGLQLAMKTEAFFNLKQAVEIFLNKTLSGCNFSYHDAVFKPAEEGCSTGVLVLPMNHANKEDTPRFPNPQKSHLSKMNAEPRLNAISYFFLMLSSKLSYVPLFHIDPLCNDLEQRLLLPEDRRPTAKMILEKQINTQLPNVIEMTVGVLQKKDCKDRQFIPLLPSQTVSLRSALSLEEKFNKGVGANLTPPHFLTTKEVSAIRKRIANLATAMQVDDYARIDVFYDITQKQLYLIEVNTLPGLTAATVLYTQALLTPSVNLKPTDFLNYIISLKIN